MGAVRSTKGLIPGLTLVVVSFVRFVAAVGESATDRLQHRCIAVIGRNRTGSLLSHGLARGGCSPDLVDAVLVEGY